MIANRVITSRLSFIFNHESRQSKRLIFKSIPNGHKCFYHTFDNKVLRHQQSHLTPTRISIYNRFLSNNILLRAMSGDSNKLTVNYDDIVKAQGEKNILIIDVREDDEIQQTGKLPGSIHIPKNNVLNELSLDSEDFEKKYGRKKPLQTDIIILSCRSGKRSAMVQAETLKSGYSNSFNYEGGWLDWENKQKA